MVLMCKEGSRNKHPDTLCSHRKGEKTPLDWLKSVEVSLFPNLRRSQG